MASVLASPVLEGGTSATAAWPKRKPVWAEGGRCSWVFSVGDSHQPGVRMSTTGHGTAHSGTLISTHL